MTVAPHLHTQYLTNRRLKSTLYTKHHTKSYTYLPTQRIPHHIQIPYFNYRHIHPTRRIRHTTPHFKHVESGKKAPTNFFQKPRNSHLGQFSTQSKTTVKSPHAQKYIDSDEMKFPHAQKYRDSDETKITELRKIADDSFSAFSDNPTTIKQKPKLAQAPTQPKLVRRSHHKTTMSPTDTPRPASRHSPEMTLARPRRAHKAHKKRIHKLRDTEVSIMTALEEIQFFNINNDDAIVNRSDARIRYANSHRMLNKVHHARSQITHGWQLAPEHSRYHHYHNIFNLHFRMIMREHVDPKLIDHTV